MGKVTSKMPARSAFLSNKDCMAAFAYFDADGTGKLEFEEMQTAFNTMLAPAVVDISSYEGSTFSAAKFKDVAEECSRSYPQYNVAGNLMKFIKDNRDAADDDGDAMSDKILKAIFDAFDADGTGEFSIMEMYKLFQFLKVPIQLLFDEKDAMDGSVDFDEFCTLLRKIDKEHPEHDIEDKINGIAAGLADGTPELSGDDPDLDADNAAQAGSPDDDAEPKNKKALLIGINYIGSSCELGGCINDARNQLKVLTEDYGFSEDNILLLTEDQDDDSKIPTAETMRNGFQWLLEGAEEGDFLFFSYSGHGSQMPCSDGSEPDGKNEILCPFDLQDDWNANSITDDYLFDVFCNQLPDGVRCLCCYDCCHSASMADLSCTRDLKPPGEEDEKHAGRFLEPSQEILDAIEAQRQEAESAGRLRRSCDAKDLAPEDVLAKKLLWTISGCQDNQTSADATINGVRQGAMTWALLESLKESSEGPMHARYDRLLAVMKKKLAGSYTQIPALSTTDQALLGRYYLASRP